MPIPKLTPKFADTFPSPMQPAVLYVSTTYRTTGHLCCCGCGEEVIAPLAPAQWTLTYNGDTVSLDPSIGNWTLPCQSHYVIRRNEVLTRRRFTPDEVIDNQANDRAALDRYDKVSGGRAISETSTGSNVAHRPRPHWWSRILHGRSRR